MTDKPCPLCGREMTAIETYAGRGELYCGHCDLTIGGNEAKTPDELMALLEQRTCHCTTSDDAWCFSCSSCGKSFPRDELHMAHNHGEINYCPNCGRRVIKEVTE